MCNHDEKKVILREYATINKLGFNGVYKIKTMAEGTVEDFMEVAGPNGRLISFVMTGDPPVQQRSRIGFGVKNVAGPGPGNPRTWSRPHMYDPSSRQKTDYAKKVQAAMVEYGLAQPYFNQDAPITLEIRFVLPRRLQDWVRHGGNVAVLTPNAQTYPKHKDVDNMLKFTMDALQGVVFLDDTTITKVIVEKMFPMKADSGGWAEISLSTSSTAPPPLAQGVWA